MRQDHLLEYVEEFLREDCEYFLNSEELQELMHYARRAIVSSNNYLGFFYSNRCKKTVLGDKFTMGYMFMCRRGESGHYRKKTAGGKDLLLTANCFAHSQSTFCWTGGSS